MLCTALRQLIALRPFHGHIDRRRALASSRDRNGDTVPGFGLEPDGGAQGIRPNKDGTTDTEFNRVLARRSLHIFDLHEEAGSVADGEEPGERAGQDHRVAHDHVGAGAPDPIAGPGDAGGAGLLPC